MVAYYHAHNYGISEETIWEERRNKCRRVEWMKRRSARDDGCCIEKVDVAIFSSLEAGHTSVHDRWHSKGVYKLKTLYLTNAIALFIGTFCSFSSHNTTKSPLELLAWYWSTYNSIYFTCCCAMINYPCMPE